MPDAFDRIIAVTVDDLTSPEKRAGHLARFAREEIAKERKEREARLGRTGRPPAVIVDGRKGASLASVKADGTVVAEFNDEIEAVAWVLRQLEIESPRLTGEYEKSHRLFVDGQEWSGSGSVPVAGREYVIASEAAYARKMEPSNPKGPQSDKAKRGVYSAIAAVAGTRFRDEAKITLGWYEIPVKGGGMSRQPAIYIEPRGAFGLEL